MIHPLWIASIGVCIIAAIFCRMVMGRTKVQASRPAPPLPGEPEMDLYLVIEDAPRFAQHVTPEMVAASEWN